MEVKGLLDDLGIREKQQFVRVPVSFQIYERLNLRFLSFLGSKEGLHLKTFSHC